MWFGALILLMIFGILSSLGDYYDRNPYSRKSMESGCLLCGLIFIVLFAIFISYSMSKY